MARYAVIENGKVVNAVEADAAFAAEQGWVKLTGKAGIGWDYVNSKFLAPEPLPPPVDDFTTTAPIPWAAAQLKIEDGSVMALGTNSRFVGGFAIDIGKYWVFLIEPFVDTDYIVFASSGLCVAQVHEDDKFEDSFIISVTNTAGEPSDASVIILQVWRAS